MSLDLGTFDIKKIGLLIIVCLVLCCTSVHAADNNTLSVSDHYIIIDPIGNHTIGDVFFINGTTNLPVTENLTINIANFDWIQKGGRMKTSSSELPLGEGVLIHAVQISPFLPGINQWSVNITGIINVSGKYSVSVISFANYTCNDDKCNLPEIDVPCSFFFFPKIKLNFHSL